MHGEVADASQPTQMRPVRRLVDLLPRSEFFREALKISAGTGAAQLIVILSSPLLTRLYSPSDYGAFAVAASILAILAAVAALGYEFAIPLPKADREAADVLALCVVVVSVVGLTSAIGLSLLTLAGVIALGLYLPLITLGLLASGVVAAFIGWAIRMKSYTEIVANRFTVSATVVVVQLGLGLLGASGIGLLVGTVSGSIAGAARLAWSTSRRDSEVLGGVTRPGILAVARRYRRFPIFSAPSILLNTLGIEAAILLIVGLYGTDVGGQFALCQRVMALPVTIVAAAIAQVYFAEAARIGRDRPKELRTLFWRTTRTLAGASIGPFILVAVTAPLAIGLVFGQTWTEAGYFVMILAPMYFLQFVISPTGATLDIAERQEMRLLREIVRLVLVGGAVVAAATLGLPPIGAVAAISIAGCLTYLLYGFVSWRAIVTLKPAPPQETC